MTWLNHKPKCQKVSILSVILKVVSYIFKWETHLKIKNSVWFKINNKIVFLNEELSKKVWGKCLKMQCTCV